MIKLTKHKIISLLGYLPNELLLLDYKIIAKNCEPYQTEIMNGYYLLAWKQNMRCYDEFKVIHTFSCLIGNICIFTTKITK